MKTKGTFVLLVLLVVGGLFLSSLMRPAVHYQPRDENVTGKRIFAELMAGEDAATAQADRVFPDAPAGGSKAAFEAWAENHQRLYMELRSKSRERIRKQFGVSEDEIARVTMKGIREQWTPLGTSARPKS